MFKNRISKVQQYLINNNIDAYVSFLCDDHGSEYIVDAYKSVAFLCGFTGSAGTLLITQTNSYLWTDGRYFLQAFEQLKASDTTLMKIGIDESLIDFVSQFKNISFDFKFANVSFVKGLIARNNKISFLDEPNLIDEIWINRPKIKNKKIFLLPKNTYLLESKIKCHKTLANIKKAGDYGVLVCALDDIAYLLNARGFDIPCNPVFISFLFLIKKDNNEEYILYINKNKLSSNTKEYLTKQNIKVKTYQHIYKDILRFKNTIYFDENKTNYKLYNLMNNKRSVILYPTIAKSIKNSLEIKESKKAHIKDAVAMCKFLYYINKNVRKGKLTEMSCSKYLEKLRKNQGAIDLSFNTICAYKEHGAIVHYNVNENTNKLIENDGLLLVDSGGQYLYGTTDITRTIALNNITEDMKYHFTLVLKAHIALSSAIFNSKTLDSELDRIARKPLWNEGLDYNHGTGHGVGHLLNVHEGPQSIRYNKANPIIMKKGMITSNEPGLYIENKYGIRHENELLCIRKGKGILGFESITYVPFDIKAIDKSLLTEKEIKWINDYHVLVYKKVFKYLTDKERKYIKEITKEI